MPALPSPAFCRCCTAPVSGLPVIFNRPGLTRLFHRTGDFARLRQAMLLEIARQPELDGLTTRESDDYAVTLIELFAAMGDVLAFYNERIADELHLRTATDRDSVLRMLRLIGYRLRPGLAAEAWLSFTLDDGAETAIREGLRVMSVPGQDEPPMFFETLAALSADWRLNALPVFAPPVPVDAFAQGTAETPILTRPEALSAGDPLVFFVAPGVEEKTVADLIEARDGERLAFAPPVQAAGVGAELGAIAKVARRLRFFGHDAPESYQDCLADPSLPPQSRWVTRTAGTAPYLVNFAATAEEYPLDRAYEDLASGTELLVDRGAGAAPRMVTAAVVATESRPATVGQRADTVTWARLERTLRGTPAALVGADGAQEVIARSGVSTAMQLRPDAASPRWDDIGALSMSAPPAAVSPTGGQTMVFARDGANRLRLNIRNAASWLGWSDLGGLLTGGPAAASDTAGRVFAFVRGPDFGLWVRVLTAAALDLWRPLFGGLTSRPVPVSWGAGHVAVFVRGPDRGLWAKSWEGPGFGAADWTAWAPLGGTLASEPAAAPTGWNCSCAAPTGSSGPGRATARPGGPGRRSGACSPPRPRSPTMPGPRWSRPRAGTGG